tara:strand:+ start:251 stop:901 length:651 start_codon:yes stop_codon:yes gene_type:complete
MRRINNLDFISQLQNDNRKNIPKNELIEILKKISSKNQFYSISKNKNKYNGNPYRGINSVSEEFKGKCLIDNDSGDEGEDSEKNVIILKKRKKNTTLKKTPNNYRMEEYLKRKDVEFLYLVGNRYCKYTPIKGDMPILIDEPENKYDKNAIRVETKRGGNIYKLGYISSDYTKYVRDIRNKMKILGIATKKNNNDPEYPYYYIIIQKTKFPCNTKN